MRLFLQATGAVLIAVILIISLKGQGRDFGILIALFVCACMGCLSARYLSPVMDFIQRLQQLGGLHREMLQILLKVAGISFITEIAVLVCSDSGNAALGKTLHFLSIAVMLYLSLPVLNQILELVEQMLDHL